MADICADTLSGVASGATLGTVSGAVSTGRILIGIEAGGGAGTIGLATIDAQGLHQIQTGRDGTLAHAAWALDGTITFDSQRAGGRHLFNIAADGSRLTQVTSDAGGAEQDVSYSPDGKRIAYEHYSCVEERDFGIQVASSDGTGEKPLTQPFPLRSVAGEKDAAFSPDGASVAFVRTVDDTQAAVWIVPATGGTARRLTDDAVDASYPRWSPDGRLILFTGRPAGADDGLGLWVVAAGGGPSTVLFKHDAGSLEFEADWSPDGRQVVYKTFRPGWDHNELGIVAADGTGARTIWVGHQSTAETPHWGR
ncbi:MAG: PD40 domain-containing protein [Chloroflexi bacterium]|nr:PD40 domain-containing protein [Chloroflexota bacterium]